MFNMNDMLEEVKFGGRFQVEHWRDGEHIATQDIHNAIVIEGLNSLLNIMFHNDTQIETWYLSLVDVVNFVTTAASDDYANIDGGNQWEEFKNYEYSANATARAEWEEDAASGGSISNTTVATFDITGAGGDVHGILLVGGGTTPDLQGDSANGGTLWATADFAANVNVSATDQLKITYTVTA